MTELSVDPHAAFTADIALSALTAACHEVGLSADDADLIRLGSNAVFRLAHDVIGRITPSAAALPNAKLQIAVARWLETLDYPATRAIAVDQPVQAAGRVVTFWRSIAPETVYAPIDQVAELIKRLHALSTPARFELPPLRPFGAPDDPFPTFAGLDDFDRAFLRQRLMWARRTFPTLDFPLGSGVIHGDANVGNVLLDPDGHAVLIDLDSFAVGPREWDLIQTALFADRFGWHTKEEYRTFVEVYGYDIMQWDGYETLADMREVAMTVWLSKKAAGDPGAAAEAHKRITAMRTGGSRRDWGAC